MLKRAYFMTAIDGVFRVGRACDEQTRDAFQPVTLDWTETVGGYNTADTVVRDRMTKQVVK